MKHLIFKRGPKYGHNLWVINSKYYVHKVNKRLVLYHTNCIHTQAYFAVFHLACAAEASLWQDQNNRFIFLAEFVFENLNQNLNILYECHVFS